MNGIHDMGGMQDMGPIQSEENEPVFHHPWEGRVAAMNRALGAWGKWNIDAGRYGIELLSPVDYLRMSYYEKWLMRNVDGNAGGNGNWQTRAGIAERNATSYRCRRSRGSRAPRQFYAAGGGG
jgi:hypothetical protein